MNDSQKVQYIIEILKSGTGGQDAANELDKVDKASKKSNESLASLKTMLGAVMAAFGGYAVIRSFVREVEEADKVNTRLTAALRVQGEQSKITRAETEALARALTSATTASEETVKTIEAQLIAFGATKRQLPELTELILDMAASGLDLNASLNAVGGGLGGKFRGLSELLKVGFDDANDSARNLADAIQIIRERMGGAARDLAKTPTGELRQLTKEYAELKEEMGRALLQGAQPWITGLTTLARWTNRFASESATTRTVVSAAFKEIALALGTVSAALIAVRINSQLAAAGLSTVSNRKLAGSIGRIGGSAMLAQLGLDIAGGIGAKQNEETIRKATEMTMDTLQRRREAFATHGRPDGEDRRDFRDSGGENQ